jgi:hypothetical protein
MTQVIHISAVSNLNLLGTRFSAKKIRESIDAALLSSENVEVDFTGVEVTQSFVDELLGPLILQAGAGLLDRLAFRGCSQNVQAVIRFVVSSRILDFANLQPTPPAQAIPVSA